MTRLDDEMDTRLVSTGAVIHAWAMDWCCWSCRKHGCIAVQITGGGFDENNQHVPRQTDEEVDESIFKAHRRESPLCLVPLGLRNNGDGLPAGDPVRGDRKHGWLWRLENNMGKRRMIIYQPPGMPPITSYKWPPWAQ